MTKDVIVTQTVRVTTRVPGSDRRATRQGGRALSAEREAMIALRDAQLFHDLLKECTDVEVFDDAQHGSAASTLNSVVTPLGLRDLYLCKFEPSPVALRANRSQCHSTSIGKLSAVSVHRPMISGEGQA
jgi:hypothetical protein